MQSDFKDGRLLRSLAGSLKVVGKMQHVVFTCTEARVFLLRSAKAQVISQLLTSQSDAKSSASPINLCQIRISEAVLGEVEMDSFITLPGKKGTQWTPASKKLGRSPHLEKIESL